MVMSEKMLEKWAEHIVGRFFTDKIALNDGVTDTAQTENLSDEQVKRLVEAVNTTAFLKKFNGMSGLDSNAQDRVVEFETACPSAVISRMLDNAKGELDMPNGSPAADLTTDLSRDLPVTRADEAISLPDPEKEPTKLGEAKEAPLNRHIVILKLEKTAEHLKEEEWQTRNDFTDATQTLLTRFRRLGADFETFEKDAFYQMGSEAAPHLQMLRRSLGKPTANYDHADMRKYARVVDMGTEEVQLLRSMMKTSRNINDCRASQERIEKHLARLA